MPTLSFTLSSSSIKSAQNELSAYIKSLEAGVEEGRKQIAERGKEMAIDEFAAAIGSDRAAGDITAEHETDASYIRTHDPVLTYNEFGTGLMGSQNPHPESGIAGWTYDVNEHGEKGWRYPKEDGTFGWTRGLPARMPMYSTGKALEKLVPEIMKEALKQKVGE